MISKQDIVDAHERIKHYIHRTPVLTSSSLDELTGCSIYFKCENFQKIGAFKMRGAMNTILSLPPQSLAKGVATHSSGNHAQAVARAAQIMNTKAYIVMPTTAAGVKKKAVLGYGASIFDCEPTQAARESTLIEVIKRTNAREIHPFNDDDVITGQATAAKELIEDIDSLDMIIAPVGGGGLLSGTSLSAYYFSPSTVVIGAEPAGADDAFRAMQSGKIEVSQASTIADGLLTSLGTKTFPIIRDHVKEVITVTDEEIIKAMKTVWERMKIVIEPSAAVPIAALFKEREKFSIRRVGIIVSGGNVDMEKALALFSSIATN